MATTGPREPHRMPTRNTAHNLYYNGVIQLLKLFINFLSAILTGNSHIFLNRLWALLVPVSFFLPLKRLWILEQYLFKSSVEFRDRWKLCVSVPGPCYSQMCLRLSWIPWFYRWESAIRHLLRPNFRDGELIYNDVLRSLLHSFFLSDVAIWGVGKWIELIDAYAWPVSFLSMVPYYRHNSWDTSTDRRSHRVAISQS